MALSRPAIGNIATSDWRYLSQRLTFSTIESNITCFSIDVHDLSSWHGVLSSFSLKNVSSMQSSSSSSSPSTPNQSLGETYIFFLYFSVFSFSQRHLHVTLHTQQVCLYVILKFSNDYRNDLKRLKTTEYSHNYDLTRICLELFLEQIYQCYCRISEL